MPASTEQERASLSAFIEMAEREGFDTAHQWYDAKGWVFFSPSTADCWRYWQAARRAPVVQVPLRKPTIDEVAEAVGYHDSAWDCVDPSELIDAILMLAAAPQPPEATVNDSLTVEAAAPDVADIIAGELQTSRGNAYDLMEQALSERDADRALIEAAPVQLPEAQAEIEVRSMKTYLD